MSRFGVAIVMDNQEVEIRRIRLVVSGLVQGVGFRWSTLRAARQFGARGWVRNRPGGDVEIVAEGPVEILEAFQAWVRKGPPGSRVENVEKSEMSRDVDEFISFEIM